MVSNLNIVTGDLEALSTDVSNVATEISGVSVTTDMADAPSAMPGSSSAGSITSAASAIEGRRSSAQTCYEDFSADVTTAANNYGVSETNVETAMRSAGHVDTDAAN